MSACHMHASTTNKQCNALVPHASQSLLTARALKYLVAFVIIILLIATLSKRGANAAARNHQQALGPLIMLRWRQTLCSPLGSPLAQLFLM